jgi:hypothetical protein
MKRILPETAATKTYRSYFIEDHYAGISAFINRPDEDSERNANMLAVGVLIPLDHGRLGKGWLHAEKLEALAR